MYINNNLIFGFKPVYTYYFISFIYSIVNRYRLNNVRIYLFNINKQDYNKYKLVTQ